MIKKLFIPSVPSFDTSTNELCLIRLTEIGAFEIPSNSAFWLKTWVIDGEGQG